MKNSNAVSSTSPSSAPKNAIGEVCAPQNNALTESGAGSKPAQVQPVKANANQPQIELPTAFLPKTNGASAATPSAPSSARVRPTTDNPLPTKPVASKSVASKSVASKSVVPVAAPVATRKSPRLRPLYVVGLVAIVALTGVAGAGVGVYNNWKNQGLIAPKVQISGENVGGLTRAQASERLNQRFGKMAFALQTGDKNVVLGLADVGGKPSIDSTVNKAFAIGRDENLAGNFMRVFGAEVKPRSFGLPIEWKRGALTSRLQIVEKQYARPAVDARLITVSGATPDVQGEAAGRALDVSATADAIQKSYFPGITKIKAVTAPVLPKIVATDLAGRDVKLGEYRTTYNGGIAGRTTNIHVACRAIDGQVLMPDEVLSFNGLTGERTYGKGYRMAHIFLREKGEAESQVVDGLAGGVCQVSSTLYNAVRKINGQSAGRPLQIVERSSHSLPVTYVPPGRDATVAWPGKDFKFRNKYDFPIYVRTAAGNGRLTISIWGRVPDNQVMPISLEN